MYCWVNLILSPFMGFSSNFTFVSFLINACLTYNYPQCFQFMLYASYSWWKPCMMKSHFFWALIKQNSMMKNSFPFRYLFLICPSFCACPMKCKLPHNMPNKQGYCNITYAYDIDKSPAVDANPVSWYWWSRIVTTLQCIPFVRLSSCVVFHKQVCPEILLLHFIVYICIVYELCPEIVLTSALFTISKHALAVG